jgi:hypothetical protein
MAYYMVNAKQVAGTAFAIATLTAVSAAFMITLVNYLDLPEVYVGPDGACVKVVNFKNGDAYTCADKDVILRKYHVVHV